MAHRGSDQDAEARRCRLVDDLRAAGHLHSAPLAQAFRAVPRHVFLPEVDPVRVYRDEAFPTKWGENGRAVSSSSQPAIMAIMLEQLAVEPGHRVLEVGAGTGYNAALLAQLVGPTGSVVTIDIDEDLVRRAREHLAACGVPRVEVVYGDGALGRSHRAPYDRLVLTVGAWDIAPAWTEQLAPGGRLVLPLSLRGVQQSVAFTQVDDHLESVSIRGCGFMPMRGAFAGPEAVHSLGDEPGLYVDLAEERSLDADVLYAALDQPGDDIRSGVRIRSEDIWGGLGLRLALHEPDVGRLSAIGPAAARGLVPALIAFPGQALTTALLGAGALAALVRLDEDHSGSFELGARPFGQDGDPLARRLLEHVRAWEAHGRPSTSQLRILAYPRDAADIPAAATIIDKRHSRLELTWQRRRDEAWRRAATEIPTRS